MSRPERTADGDRERPDVCWAYGEASDAAYLVILRAQQFARAEDGDHHEKDAALDALLHAVDQLDQINARIRQNLGEEE